MPSERETASDDHLSGDQLDLGLREHDREVLRFLSQNPSSLLGFQSLRRQLGIHPEQLSRALRRLAVGGLVEQTELGYRATQRAIKLLNATEAETSLTGYTVLQTAMPADLDVRAFVTALKGTWMGPLRWQGLTDAPDGVTLSWSTEDNKISIDAHIIGRQLTISAHIEFQERLDEAIRLGHMLFQHLVRSSAQDDITPLSA